MQHIVVIGGGVIGLSTAVALRVAGFNVTVIEKGAFGQGCSWVAGGILSALPPWGYAPPVVTLIEHSERLYPEWIKNLVNTTGIDPEYRASGMLVLPPFDDQAVDQFKSGTTAEITTRSAYAIEAALPDVPAIWMPKVAQVRSNRLLKCLYQAALKLGVTLLPHTKVSALEIKQAHITSASTGRNRYPADAVVLCAGAWSTQLLGVRALKMEVHPMRGEMLLFKGAPCARPILYRNGFYLITRSDGLILAGSTLENSGFDARPTADARDKLHALAIGLLPELKHSPVVAQWAGLRPGSPGNVPIVSPHPEIKNLFINTGHFRYGITMAPASADIVVNSLLGLTQPIDVTPYLVLN